MLKKSAILGSVLLTLGMSALISVYGWRDSFSFKPLLHLLGQGNRLDFISTAKPQWSQPDLSDPNLIGTLTQRSEEEQHRLLQANMQFLIVNAPEDSQLAEALYGENWQEEVEAFKRKLARKETLATGSTVVTIIAVFTLLMTGVTGVAHGLIQQIKQQASEREEETPEEVPDETAEDKTPTDQSNQTSVSSETPKNPEKRERLADSEQSNTPSQPRPKLSVEYRRQEDKPAFRRKYPSVDYGFATQNFDEQQVEHLLSDESSVPPEKRLQQQVSLKRPSDTPRPTTGSNSSTQENQSDLQSQTAALAAQVAQLTEQTHEKQSNEDAEPVNEALKNLSEQISAIRTFAATQQDRVEKLQSGYDWNIIRTFCLRIIRCIDNLENRITRQEEEDQVIDHLTDVRDELLFALESSGVEQYELDIESAFRGQERRAEAVKEKEPSPSEELKGCIAAVVSPGYQYVIDEDNMRVVRMARVKLYE